MLVSCKRTPEQIRSCRDVVLETGNWKLEIIMKVLWRSGVIVSLSSQNGQADRVRNTVEPTHLSGMTEGRRLD